MKKYCRVISFFMLLNSVFLLEAQRTYVRQNPEEKYREAVELFNREKYASANELMIAVKNEAKPGDENLKMNAAFYAAVSEARLLHKNAAKSLTQFLKDYPESVRNFEVYMELANIYYVDKAYRKCYETYDKIDIKDLTDKQKIEYHFKKGYSYFMTGKNDAAKVHFYEVKKSDNAYVPLASYYYAYILYTEGSYQTALDEFEKLKGDESFGQIVPFYIIQIYYKQGKNNQVIQEGPALLESASPRRAVEMSRLIGEAYYNENRYEEALPYLDMYFQKAATRPTREDDYILGFTYYNLKKYDTAVIYFQRVVTQEKTDLMAQNTLYHLGDAYVRLNLKRFALAAFQDASKIDIDERMQEDAFYNYAKLSYELALSPYNEAIRSFEAYLEKYPNSRYADEIYGYLVNMYLTTKNYKDAYNSISRVNRKDPRMLEAFQRIAFNRGVELFNDRKYQEATGFFETAIENDYDEKIVALASYWKGECAYRQGALSEAIMDYDKFLLSSIAETMPEYYLGNYSIGYAYFQLKRYQEALKAFRVLTNNADKIETQLLNDAYLRAGDANFMLKKMDDAIKDYNAAIALNQHDVDYAMLQKSLCLGVLGRFDEKINVLQSMLAAAPKSLLKPKALNELASTYLIKGDNAKALENFGLLIKDYPKSSYGKLALLKQGLIYFNTGRNNDALKTFEKVIADYPGTVEAKEALMSIRNIYVAMNKVDDFFAYVKKIGAHIQEDAQDSISFAAAENRYMENDCQGAKPSLVSYLSKFPEGLFITEANYYLADCEMQSGNPSNALTYFDKVIELPESFYTERSMLTAARIVFDQKNYADALKRYQAIAEYSETQANVNMALIAILRCELELQGDQRILAAAQNVLQIESLTDDIKDEAIHAVAVSAGRLGQAELAKEYYTKLLTSKNSHYVAEAQYYQIEEIFKKQDYDEAEKLIFDYITNAPSSEYYLAKVYILWGEIYFDKGNYMQAKQTFQSILDNYEGDDDIKDLAQKAYQKVLDREEEIRQAEDRQREMDAIEEDEELFLPEL